MHGEAILVECFDDHQPWLFALLAVFSHSRNEVGHLNYFDMWLWFIRRFWFFRSTRRVPSSTCTAHFLGDEVSIIIWSTAPICINSIRRAYITSTVACAIISVFARRLVCGPPITCTAHLLGFEVIVIIRTAPTWRSSVLLAHITISIWCTIISVFAWFL